MGLYGSPDTGNLYTKKKSKDKKKNFKNGLWIIVLIICIGIYVIGSSDTGQMDTASSANEKSVTDDLGARLSPAEIGDALQGNVTDISGLDCLLEVELMEVVKGDNAIEMAKDIHTYVSLEENQQYLFARVRIKNIKDNSNKDIPFGFNWTNFSYATGDYRKYDYTMGLVAGGDLLESVELYEGAEHTGWICLYVEKDDLEPKMIFLNNLWFNL